ncbi:MAG: LysM peptidoglycan-binding domain-containing protein [Candidatus Fimivivens sp.]
MYAFYMDGVRQPIAPSKISVKIKNQNKTYTLLSGGEINALKNPGLSEIAFEVIYPNRRYPFAVYEDGVKTADYYLSELERLKVSNAPFIFLIARVHGNRLLYSTDFNVSIEDYTIIESADAGSDVTVKIKLKQYLDIVVKKVAITLVDGEYLAKAPDKVTRPAKTPPKTYTVVPGDSLWKICQKELGDGSRYPEVAKFNGISNPNLIYPGQVIRFG